MNSTNCKTSLFSLLLIFTRLRHRGPDWSGIHCFEDCYLAHQRLAIMDPTSGDQPLYNEDKTIVVTVCTHAMAHSFFSWAVVFNCHIQTLCLYKKLLRE